MLSILILYGGQCDFKGKFSLSLYLFVFNLNQPPDPQNYVPTNVPIFMDPRKLDPMKINDFTVAVIGKKFLPMGHFQLFQ